MYKELIDIIPEILNTLNDISTLGDKEVPSEITLNFSFQGSEYRVFDMDGWWIEQI